MKRKPKLKLMCPCGKSHKELFDKLEKLRKNPKFMKELQDFIDETTGKK